MIRTYQEMMDIRKRSILIGPKIPGIVDLLQCTQIPQRYEKLRIKSKIKFKQSFIKYLKFCVEKGLIVNTTVTKKKNPGKIYESWFIISEKGRIFLEMIE